MIHEHLNFRFITFFLIYPIERVSKSRKKFYQEFLFDRFFNGSTEGIRSGYKQELPPKNQKERSAETIVITARMPTVVSLKCDLEFEARM